MRNKTKWH